MPIQHSLWTVGETPAQVTTSELDNEKLLEDMIVAEPRILSDEWMLIGRQEVTDFGGRVDLLAIAPDASLVLIELKKDRTTRDVISQTLEYASWLVELESKDIAAIYKRFKTDGTLNEDFFERFGQHLEEDTINESHQIVVVASMLDARTERVVRYLEGWSIPINILSFEVFQSEGTKFLSRTWLFDPLEVQVNASTMSGSEREPWNGEFYACFLDDEQRRWNEAIEHGFISASGGTWHTNTLNLLSIDARVWVKDPNHGFIGVGRVIGPRQSALEFEIGGRPALEVLKASYH